LSKEQQQSQKQELIVLMAWCRQQVKSSCEYPNGQQVECIQRGPAQQKKTTPLLACVF
jgi:hypothetical protein